jgi:exodeoxyribonuclease V
MDFTASQSHALLAVKHWNDNPTQQTFRLFGYAGTGKTTLAKDFSSGISGNVLFAAYTGKAASVMQKKGCVGATTIHKILYKPAPKSTATLQQLTEELHQREDELKALGQGKEEIAADPVMVKINKALDDEKQHHKPRFVLNEESPIKDAALLVLDEASFIDGFMGQDLESFGTPILVLGDPAQLPPVRGFGFFTEAVPDILLTEIHRQAKDNPILKLATDVREGRQLQIGQYGDSKVITKPAVDKDEVIAADQVIVGKNKTRFTCNHRMRELLGKHAGLTKESLGYYFPEKDDRLICLRNNHDIGILNGTQWKVDEVTESPIRNGFELELLLTSEDADNQVGVTAHQEYFMGNEPPYYAVKERECFDFSYAVTCHKAQGSQWNNVYLFDESSCFRQDARKWLYTAITRAAEKITVVLE